jgi:hypothetical protein
MLQRPQKKVVQSETLLRFVYRKFRYSELCYGIIKSLGQVFGEIKIITNNTKRKIEKVSFVEKNLPFASYRKGKFVKLFSSSVRKLKHVMVCTKKLMCVRYETRKFLLNSLLWEFINL